MSNHAISDSERGSLLRAIGEVMRTYGIPADNARFENEIIEFLLMREGISRERAAFIMRLSPFDAITG